MSNIISKPWGAYEDYYRNNKVVFKRIIIQPGQSISYQVHKERGEFWLIAQGRGQFKWSVDTSPKENYSVAILEEGRTVEIPAGTAHQISCVGDDPLIIYEMQYGKCDEFDITRIEDPYQR